MLNIYTAGREYRSKAVFSSLTSRGTLLWHLKNDFCAPKMLSLRMQNTLPELAGTVLKHLGIPDEDYTLSNFVLNLFNQSKPKNGNHLPKFVNAIEKNGGEDFPNDFVRECFRILETSEVKKDHAQVNNDPIIKKEPSDPIIKKEQTDPIIKKNLNDPIIKKEQTDLLKRDDPIIKKEPEYSGLSLPDIKREDLPQHIKLEDLKKHDYSIKNEYKSKNDYSRIDNPIIENQIYKGYVSNLATYGAFIRLNNPKSSKSGLCHVSQILFDPHTRIRTPSDVLKFNQQVFVKVILIEQIPSHRQPRDKISLSMRGIDQITGVDKSDELENGGEERNDHGRGREQSFGRKRRRFTSPERWEIRQLIASGAASADDYPELNGLDDEEDSEDELKKNEDLDIDIELNSAVPKFLQGKAQDAVELAPAKVFKNPEGSMNRTAKNGSKLARDFKEEKLKERKDKDRELRQERAKSMEAYDPMLKKSQPRDDATNTAIKEWKNTQKTESFGKRTTLPMKEQRETLPVFSMRSQLLKTIRENQFVVIVGETGSGKTTQIVQYLKEEGFDKDAQGRKKIIGCTQPRRVAAVSVAKRVSEEVGCRLGDEVGYTIRFEDRTSSKTVIKYMTDGMLQMEALNDAYMSKYSVIMLDEAHERTIATDVLFVLLKQATLKNPNLKVIITSATLDSRKFSKYFNDCPVLKIPGRTFPVEVLYTKQPEMDYLAAALESVVQIHLSEPQGDILVFLTGQEEIDTSCEVLIEKIKVLGDLIAELIILPVYSALPSEMQSRIFEPTPPGSRKVILATNIAETSITIDGIYYVVDPGFVKINAYDPKLGMDSLIVSPISQAQANQRSGRAGRTGPGKCYRLYTETAYKNEMLANTIPEIQRQNLAYTILMLKAMGINDLLNFEFMDPPLMLTMLTALRDLYNLSALDEESYLTELGHRMADFPMEPALTKTLIKSVEFECTEEIVSIVAMLSVQTIFYRPKEKQQLADQKKARFQLTLGDHLTLLNVYRGWALNGYSQEWCKDNYIQERSMQKVADIRRQLVTIMQRLRYPMVSSGSNLDKVRRALCSGFFKNSVKRDGTEGGYKTLVENTPVHLHPSSSLFGKSPDYLVYHTLLLTTREYMHCVTVIDPHWLPELAPQFFKVGDPTKLNDLKKKQKIVPLHDKFNGDSWRLSSHDAAKRKALANDSNS